MSINDNPTERIGGLPETGKTEVVHGRLILLAPVGEAPSYASGEIFASLRDYARTTGYGRAVGDNAGFLVNLPHRTTFSPSVGYYVGRTRGLRLFHGAPVFAVEIRSEYDYGSVADACLAARRADYFLAKTRVVWDVDLLNDDVVRVYRASSPDTPRCYGRGELAEAEPALPGWRLPVDELFLPDW